MNQNQTSTRKTHRVLDLHNQEGSQSCFEGTYQECLDFLSQQTPHFMYKIARMTAEEMASHPDNQKSDIESSQIEKPDNLSWEVKTNEFGVQMAIVNRDHLVKFISYTESLDSQLKKANELISIAKGLLDDGIRLEKNDPMHNRFKSFSENK